MLGQAAQATISYLKLPQGNSCFPDAAKTVLEGFAVTLSVIPLPIIIPWARRGDIMSAKEDIAYKDRITGSHFGIGGIDQIIIPLHISSSIMDRV